MDEAEIEAKDRGLGGATLPAFPVYSKEVREMKYGAYAAYEIRGTQICRWCDDRIEDDPISYEEPVEIEGLGTVHAFCAEEALARDVE